MAKKERKEKKEKPLEKMTTKELKDIALEIPAISGVHGMNKSELISAVKQARGIVETKPEKEKNTREIKKQIAELKTKKKQAQQAGEKKKINVMRRRINRLKKQTRRAA
jgi:3-deoxy-D-manno-octulosonic-acid transferase